MLRNALYPNCWCCEQADIPKKEQKYYERIKSSFIGKTITEI